MCIKSISLYFAVILLTGTLAHAATFPVGSGSYITHHPGHDEAGRNHYPAGAPQLSGNAVGKPIPSNDWWCKLLNTDHVNNLFNYPL